MTTRSIQANRETRAHGGLNFERCTAHPSHGDAMQIFGHVRHASRRRRHVSRGVLNRWYGSGLTSSRGKEIPNCRSSLFTRRPRKAKSTGHVQWSGVEGGVGVRSSSDQPNAKRPAALAPPSHLLILHMSWCASQSLPSVSRGSTVLPRDLDCAANAPPMMLSHLGTLGQL